MTTPLSVKVQCDKRRRGGKYVYCVYMCMHVYAFVCICMLAAVLMVTMMQSTDEPAEKKKQQERKNQKKDDNEDSEVCTSVRICTHLYASACICMDCMHLYAMNTL